MKIALFGNAMKRMTLGEVSHVLEFMELRQVEVYLSQELRQEMNLRDYPPFPAEEKAWKEFTDEGIRLSFYDSNRSLAGGVSFQIVEFY